MADEVKVIDEWAEDVAYLTDPVRSRLVQAHGRYRMEGWVGDRWTTLGGEVPVALGRRLSALLAERRQESEPEGVTLGFFHPGAPGGQPSEPEGGR